MELSRFENKVAWPWTLGWLVIDLTSERAAGNMPRGVAQARGRGPAVDRGVRRNGDVGGRLLPHADGPASQRSRASPPGPRRGSGFSFCSATCPLQATGSETKEKTKPSGPSCPSPRFARGVPVPVPQLPGPLLPHAGGCRRSPARLAPPSGLLRLFLPRSAADADDTDAAGRRGEAPRATYASAT